MLQKIANSKSFINPSLSAYDFELIKEGCSISWRSLEIEKNAEMEMKPYQNALSQIVERTIAEYNPKLESMIEIGSGRYPITHFLPNFQNKDQIHLSEFNTNCLRLLKKRQPENTIRQINILSPNQTKRAYQTVVMSDILNIFSKDELGKALRGVDKLLEPGGHLIHFSMRSPIFIETIDNLEKAQLKYIPIVDQYNLWQGVYVINREKLLDFIFALKTDLMRKVLLEYMSLNPFLQNEFCLENLGTSNLQMFYDLSKPLEEHSGLVTEKILFEERYRENLKMKLDERNFTILEFQDKEGRYCGPPSEVQFTEYPKANTFFIKQMIHLHSFNDKMPLGQIQEQAVAHVLVAQKPTHPTQKNQ